MKSLDYEKIQKWLENHTVKKCKYIAPKREQYQWVKSAKRFYAWGRWNNDSGIFKEYQQDTLTLGE